MHKLKDRGEAQLQFLRRNLARLRDDIDGKHRQLHLLGLELDNIEYSESFHEDEIRQIRKSAKQDKGQIRRARRKRIKKNIEKIMNDPISFNIAIDHFASVVPKMSGMAHDDTERTQPFNAPAFTGFLHGKSASNVFNTADDKHAGSNSPSCRSLRVVAAASSTPYYVCVRSADDRELKINLANTSELTFEMLLSFVSQYWGVDDNQYMLQTDYSLPVPSKRNCLDWLQHLAVSDRVLHREQPRYIGPREAFQVIDDDKSGQVGVNEFVKLFERSRIPQTKMQAPYVFAAIDKDDSGEVTYAEFAQEWDVIYDVLKRDISWDELPLVYLIPRRVHLRTAAENNGISNFSIGSGKGSENPLGSLVKPESLNMSPLLAFELFDSDQTGSVNFIEFQAVFNKLNTDSEQQSEFRAELRELFNETNTSHSGEINYGEFQQNFSKILETMAEHSRLFETGEVLNELSDAIGTSAKKKLSRRLPEYAARLVRGIFGYIVFVVILSISVIGNASLDASYYYRESIRSIAAEEKFGHVIWLGSYPGNHPFSLKSRAPSTLLNVTSNVTASPLETTFAINGDDPQAKAFAEALDLDSNGEISSSEVILSLTENYWLLQTDANELLKNLPALLKVTTSPNEFLNSEIVSAFPSIAQFANKKKRARINYASIFSVDDVWQWVRHALRHALIQSKAKTYPVDNVPLRKRNARLYNENVYAGRSDKYNNSYSLFSNRLVGHLTLTKTENAPSSCAHGTGTNPFRSYLGNDKQPNECSKQNRQESIVLAHENKNDFKNQIDDLIDKRWLEEDLLGNLKLEGLLYNPSINRFMQVTFTIDHLSCGTYRTSVDFAQIQIDQLVLDRDRANFVLFVFATLYSLYMITEQVSWYRRRSALGHSFRSTLKNYCLSMHLVLQTVMIVFQLLSASFRLAYFFNNDRLEFAIGINTSTTLSFFWLYRAIRMLDTVVTTFAWIRIGHYLKISQFISFMSEVIFEVSKKAGPYLLVFIWVISGFNAFAVAIFGPHSRLFSGFFQSFVTLFQMVFEKVDMEDATVANPVLSSIFLLVYYVTIVLVMRNIFVAIFIDGYRTAAEKYERAPPPVILWTLRGVLGAIFPSLQPQDMVKPSDPVTLIDTVGTTMGNRLKRVDIRTVKDLQELTDRDISVAISRTAFISKTALENYRREARVLVDAYNAVREKEESTSDVKK